MKAACMLVLLVPAFAVAEPRPAVLVNEVNPPQPGPVATTLYLNRCTGGCVITGGDSDAATAQTSSLPCAGGASCSAVSGTCSCASGAAGTYTVHEFTNDAGLTGSAADADWAAVVQCVKEVYSPYGVTITEVKPVNTTYNVAVISGVPEDIGWPSTQIVGIAHVPSDCTPTNNVISFSFANVIHGPNRVFEICALAAQESAHAYGLEHEWEFVADHSSACKSPMSYRNDCGGQKFFRNEAAACGELASRPCKCNGTQNSHIRLLAAAGAGTPITKPPTVSVVSPTGGTVQNGVIVNTLAGAQRGIAKVELWLNNWKWAEVPGAPWSTMGQPDPSSYQLKFPDDVPDGVIDIQVKAYDDLPVETDSTVITVMKGAPCADASSCAKGQNCAAGKCYWDPPTGMLGDACTYPQFCTSNICSGTADKQICTQDCLVGATDSCPMGYDCIMTNGVNGICFPAQASSGCCSATGGAAWANAGLSAIVLGFVVRRRRRR